MKRYLVFVLVILNGIVFGQNKDKARQQIMSMLERNNPDAYYMLTSLYKMPTKFKSGNVTISSSPPSDFMVYSQRYKAKEILSDISTVVHETCHMYQSQKPNMLLIERGIPLDFDTDYSVYYIGKTEEYLVKHTPTFPSVKMAGDIPSDLQSFRYDTYIKTNQSVLGTQQSGVYGLMDEWSAYYNGFKTTVLNFDEYPKSEGNMDGYFNFLSDAGSIHMAYPEFKYYILQYLEYASRMEKSIYDQIMTNEDFKTAFVAIDNAYSSIIEIYNLKKLDIEKTAKTKGLDYRESDDYIMIGNKGVGSFKQEYSGYEKAINQQNFKVIIEKLSQ